ncbi:MAG: DUF4422 domain-containing protein [Ferruginibacter sp.]|nr:DUF4422 domain-containing protein [Ferruginibacter sp.]
MESKPNFTIFSVHHKFFALPNVGYIKPIHAGKKISAITLPFEGDDGIENISHLNKNFAELTVLYHIWKNYKKEEIPYWGLCHYRRYFCLPQPPFFNKRLYKFKDADKAFGMIFTPSLEKKITEKLQYGYIILPKKYYFIKLKKWSVKKQFIKDHNEESWLATEDAIKKLYPHYYNSIGSFMNGYSCSWYNMAIANYDFWNRYLTFLFTILFEVQKNIIIPETPTMIRVLGNISERLLPAYIYHYQMQKKLKVYYLPVAEIR